VLQVHRLAERLDLTPLEFGRAEPVDESDASAVFGEWLRLIRLWADYSPEQVFALKAGGALLLIAIVGMWIVIAVMY
jgi:hypothetical protein